MRECENEGLRKCESVREFMCVIISVSVIFSLFVSRAM